MCFLAHSIGTQVKATNDGECYELIPLVLGLVRSVWPSAGPGAAQTVKGPGATRLMLGLVLGLVQGLVQRRLLKGLVQRA